MAQANKLRKAKSLFSTTLSVGIGTGTSDTITPNSVTGLPTDTEISLTFDRIDSGGTATPTKMERITGTISAGNFTAYTRAVEGTEQAHASGAVIEYIFNGDDWNDHIDAHLAIQAQDGNLKSGLQINDTTADHQYILGVSELTADRTVTLPLLSGNDSFSFVAHTETLTNKTLTSPAVNTPTLVLADTSPTADGSIGFDRTGEDLQIGDGTNSKIVHMGEWVAYNPASSGVTLGSGTLTGAYARIGNTIHFRISFTMAADSSISGMIVFALPVTAASGVGIYGRGRIVDSGTGYFDCWADYNSTTTLAVKVWAAGGTYTAAGNTSSTIPMTWTTSDAIYIEGTYEAA